MTSEKLNLPGTVARYFIESKLTVLMMLGLLCFGAIGLLLTPREENPQIIVPAAEVTVSFPGASPLEVEHLLLSPLESDLASIDGVKHIYGTALEGIANVMLEFEVGEDKEDAIVRLYDMFYVTGINYHLDLESLLFRQSILMMCPCLQSHCRPNNTRTMNYGAWLSACWSVCVA